MAKMVQFLSHNKSVAIFTYIYYFSLKLLKASGQENEI